MPCPPEHLSEATHRGHTMAPEAQKPSQWLCLTQLPREMYSQPIVHKALARDIIGKLTPILAEIMIRKSQDIGTRTPTCKYRFWAVPGSKCTNLLHSDLGEA